jgi:hypothetical protein
MAVTAANLAAVIRALYGWEPGERVPPGALVRTFELDLVGVSSGRLGLCGQRLTYAELAPRADQLRAWARGACAWILHRMRLTAEISPSELAEELCDVEPAIRLKPVCVADALEAAERNAAAHYRR